MLYCLPQIIERAAERAPGHEAIRFAGESLDYAELVTRSNRLARCLVDEGIRRNDRVGIAMRKSMETAVAIHGILRAGAAYVPLDAASPPARLSSIIRGCGIRHLVIDETRIETLRDLAAAGTKIDCCIGISRADDALPRCVPWEEVNSLPGESAPDIGLTELDLAYILYTSGTTGEPKGMMHTHRSSLSFVEWAAEAHSLEASDRLTNNGPLHFDLSTFDFFSGALAGATTVIVPEPHTKLPASLSKLLEDERISVCYTVPAALTQLLLRGALDKRDLGALRWVLFGGESLPIKHLRSLMEQLPETRFSHLYGVTETNVCTFFHVPSPLLEARDKLPIGRLLPNMDALVVDEEDRALEGGEAGELLIRGPAVMRGYWGQEELTREAFFRSENEAGLENVFYRTGDLVRRGVDGNFEFLGRKDRQVKVRGYRIELDEIESALLSYELVREAAVYTVSDGLASIRIEAAVTVAPGKELEHPELLRHLAKRLPDYAIPARISELGELPRTSTGKVDQRRLQETTCESARDTGRRSDVIPGAARSSSRERKT